MNRHRRCPERNDAMKSNEMCAKRVATGGAHRNDAMRENEMTRVATGGAQTTEN